MKSTISIRKTFSDRRAHSEAGFTLMELLIVVSIIVVIMLIAIPEAGKIKRHANEVSAQASLQALMSAESMYQSTYPTAGYACTIQALAGDPGAGQSSAQAAGIINGQLATGVKDGYMFNITNCTKVTANNSERITGYTLTAVPATIGRSGDRGFCLESSDGSMKADPAGGTNCTQLAQ
jgi:type IV pilus assembly protein PilA